MKSSCLPPDSSGLLYPIFGLCKVKGITIEVPHLATQNALVPLLYSL